MSTSAAKDRKEYCRAWPQELRVVVADDDDKRDAESREQRQGNSADRVDPPLKTRPGGLAVGPRVLFAAGRAALLDGYLARSGLIWTLQVVPIAWRRLLAHNALSARRRWPRLFVSGDAPEALEVCSEYEPDISP
jgi:hypothetical protein